MNPLTELIPAKYRQIVYVIATAAAFAYGLWQASNGDVRTFVIAIVSSLATGLAASNTSVNKAVEEEEYLDEDGEQDFDEEHFIDGHDGETPLSV